MSTSKRLDMLEAVLAKTPADAFPWYAYAMELRSLERLDDALRAFADVSARFPGYVPTYLMAGQVAMELQRLDAANEWLTRGVKIAEQVKDSHALGELQSALAEVESLR